MAVAVCDRLSYCYVNRLTLFLRYCTRLWTSHQFPLYHRYILSLDIMRHPRKDSTDRCDNLELSQGGDICTSDQENAVMIHHSETVYVDRAVWLHVCVWYESYKHLLCLDTALLLWPLWWRCSVLYARYEVIFIVRPNQASYTSTVFIYTFYIVKVKVTLLTFHEGTEGRSTHTHCRR